MPDAVLPLAGRLGRPLGMGRPGGPNQVAPAPAPAVLTGCHCCPHAVHHDSTRAMERARRLIASKPAYYMATASGGRRIWMGAVERGAGEAGQRLRSMRG